MRSIFLDRDLPSYQVSQLQPIDEFFYTIPAFNLFHYGSMTHQVVPYVPTDGFPLNIVENLMTWLTLAAFGNDYYGLRMASVIAALGVFLLLFTVLRRNVRPTSAVTSGDRWPAIIALLWLVYLLFDFAFAVSAGVAEPTIFRMLGMVVLMAVASSWPRQHPGLARPFMLGMLATAAWLFVYFYNAFLLPAMLLTLVAEGLKGGWRQAAKEAGAAVTGCFVAAAAYALIVYATYGQSLVQVYDLYIAPGSQRVIPASALALLAHFYAIAGTNLFRFNIPLLVIFAAALPVFAYRTWIERSSIGLLVGSLLVFLVLQSLFATDYPLRKLVMLSPLVVIIVAMAQLSVRPFLAALRKAPALRIPLVVYAIAATWLVVRIYMKTTDARPGFLFDLNLLGLLALAGAFVVAVLTRGTRERALMAVVIATLALPGAYLELQQFYLHPTYRYRDAMIAAAPILDNKVTAGAFSIAFRLYNSSIPVLNPYQYELVPGGMAGYNAKLDRLLTDGTAQYSIAGVGISSLVEVARYEVDVERYKFLVVYRPG